MKETEINGWRFKEATKVGNVLMKDEQGEKYRSMLLQRTNRVLIERVGMTRRVEIPRFVVDHVIEEMQRVLERDDLMVVNKIKEEGG